MSSLNSNDTNYDINILTGIAMAGIAIKLLFYQNTSDDGVNGPANSAIWGYGVVAIALFGMLYITFSLATKTDMQNSPIQFIKTIFNTSFPVLFILGILIWLIILNVSYQTRINKGQVTKDFRTFGYVSTALIVLQIIVILKYVRDKLGIKSIIENNDSPIAKALNAVTEQMASIGYAIGTVNYLIVIILQIALEYFSTDG
jgi:hypothetical protein